MKDAASVSEILDPSDNVDLNPDDEKCSVTLFLILAWLLREKALSIEEGAGLEGWCPDDAKACSPPS